jgi:hypothetical protein
LQTNLPDVGLLCRSLDTKQLTRCCTAILLAFLCFLCSANQVPYNAKLSISQAIPTPGLLQCLLFDSRLHLRLFTRGAAVAGLKAANRVLRDSMAIAFIVVLYLCLETMHDVHSYTTCPQGMS